VDHYPRFHVAPRHGLTCPAFYSDIGKGQSLDFGRDLRALGNLVDDGGLVGVLSSFALAGADDAGAATAGVHALECCSVAISVHSAVVGMAVNMETYLHPSRLRAWGLLSARASGYPARAALALLGTELGIGGKEVMRGGGV
jgi:hypothetical protein